MGPVPVPPRPRPFGRHFDLAGDCGGERRGVWAGERRRIAGEGVKLTLFFSKPVAIDSADRYLSKYIVMALSADVITAYLLAA